MDIDVDNVSSHKTREENDAPHQSSAEEESDEEDGPQWANNQAYTMSEEEAFLRDSARTPLFHNARVSSLSAVILLLNSLRMHGLSSVLINEIFSLLSKVILPAVNSLPSSEYEASKMLRKLGLNYNMIDVCPNQCLLYRGHRVGRIGQLSYVWCS